MEWFTVSPSISSGNVRKLDLAWGNLWPEIHLLLLKLSVLCEDHSLAKMLLRCFTDLPCQVLIVNILYIDEGTSFLISNMSCPVSVCVSVCARAQSCPTLCEALNYSPPWSSVHVIFQARVLECATISYSRGSSRPGDQTHITCVFCIPSGFFTH